MRQIATRELTDQEFSNIAHCNVSHIVRHGSSDTARQGEDGSADDPGPLNPADYPRVYRNVIKGLWEPGAWDQLASFVGNASDRERMHSIGFNTISVVSSFDVTENGEYNFPHKDMVDREIRRYKN